MVIMPPGSALILLYLFCLYLMIKIQMLNPFSFQTHNSWATGVVKILFTHSCMSIAGIMSVRLWVIFTLTFNLFLKKFHSEQHITMRWKVLIPVELILNLTMG